MNIFEIDGSPLRGRVIEPRSSGTAGFDNPASRKNPSDFENLIIFIS
jgi:hypothetical protein